MVNQDLRLWVNELIRFSLGSQPAVVPPPPKMAFEVSPVPAVGRTAASFQGGGELLNIVEEASQGQRGVKAGGARHKTAAGTPSPGTVHPKKTRHQLCRLSLSTGKCRWRDSICVHDTPPVN